MLRTEDEAPCMLGVMRACLFTLSFWQIAGKDSARTVGVPEPTIR